MFHTSGLLVKAKFFKIPSISYFKVKQQYIICLIKLSRERIVEPVKRYNSRSIIKKEKKKSQSVSALVVEALLLKL